MNILITGTRSGIGNRLARHFCLAGHAVWGVSRGAQVDFQKECEEKSLAFRSSQCDVADWPQVRELRDKIGAAWASLDRLVCCAGTQAPIGGAMHIDPQAWSRNVRQNLDGTFYSIRAFHDLLARSAIRAKVICFSGGGATGPRANFSAYACAKTAVVRLVENLADEWRNESIDINAIAPGAINTAMTDEVLSLGPEVAGEREYNQAVKQKAGGGASFDKVKALMDFLLSPDSDGISGKLISAQWDSLAFLQQHRQELLESDVFCLRRIVPEDRNLK